MASRRKKPAEQPVDSEVEFDPAKLESTPPPVGHEQLRGMLAAHGQRKADEGDEDELKKQYTGRDQPAETGPEVPPSPPAAAPATEPHRPVLPRVGDRLPDPHAVDQIRLSDDPDGPVMRLLRGHRDPAVWIAFDANPGKEVTDRIKDAGFRWERRAEVNGRPGAWVKPLEPGHEIRAVLDAERLFKDLGNQIRAARDLKPVGVAGPGVG